MDATRDVLLTLLYQCIDELNEQLPPQQQLLKAPQTALFGDSGRLDSLSFVNFIALVEEKYESHFGLALSLTDDSAKQDGAGAFDTVGELAQFIEEILIDKKIIAG